MIENIVTCDRCKKKCEGTTYYTVDIYANDIKSIGDGSVTMKTASQNAQTNTYKLFNQEKHYCESCRDKIEAFLKDDSSDAFVKDESVSNETSQVKDYPSYLDRPKKKWGGFMHI